MFSGGVPCANPEQEPATIQLLLEVRGSLVPKQPRQARAEQPARARSQRYSEHHDQNRPAGCGQDGSAG